MGTSKNHLNTIELEVLLAMNAINYSISLYGINSYSRTKPYSFTTILYNSLKIGEH